MEDRREICDLLNSQGLTRKGVEVRGADARVSSDRLGRRPAQYAKHILNNWKGVLYLVDPWPVDNHADYANSEYMRKTTETLRGVEDRGIMIRAFSHQAVELFRDESLDFVYINADHSYKGTKQDIELWFPKVKKGGLVSGHNYLRNGGRDWYDDMHLPPNKKDKSIYVGGECVGVFGVNPAVDEFVEKNNYKLKTTRENYFGTWYFLK